MSESERVPDRSAMGELIAGMMHDLRQPLTALRLDLGGAVQLLRHEPPAVAEALLALEDAMADVRRIEESVGVFRADGHPR